MNLEAVNEMVEQEVLGGQPPTDISSKLEKLIRTNHFLTLESDWTHNKQEGTTWKQKADPGGKSNTCQAAAATRSSGPLHSPRGLCSKCQAWVRGDSRNTALKKSGLHVLHI